jgi:large subunit ribosomal protein L9
VTGSDIADFLKAKGFDIDRRRLILPEPIKAIGTYEVPLKLHRQVIVPLKVNVVKEGAPREAAKAADTTPAGGDQPSAE